MATNTRARQPEASGILPDILAHQCGDCTYYFCVCPPKSRISFGIWANMQAFIASFALLGGAIIASSFSQTSNTLLYIGGQYVKYLNIPIALFVMFVEYPRGLKKDGGRVEERPFQSYIAPIHYLTFFVGRNYFIRSIVYILLSLPSQLSLSTTMAGFMLISSGFFYFIAALYDEGWNPPTLSWGRDSVQKKDGKAPAKTGELTEAPSEPAPRFQHSNVNSIEVDPHQSIPSNTGSAKHRVSYSSSKDTIEIAQKQSSNKNSIEVDPIQSVSSNKSSHQEGSHASGKNSIEVDPIQSVSSNKSSHQKGSYSSGKKSIEGSESYANTSV